MSPDTQDSKSASQTTSEVPVARRRGAGLALLALAVAGLALAAYLSAIHYALLFGNLALGAVCGAGGDCNAVLASRYGPTGRSPVPPKTWVSKATAAWRRAPL